MSTDEVARFIRALNADMRKAAKREREFETREKRLRDPMLSGYLEALLFCESAWWKVPPEAADFPSLDEFYSVSDFSAAFVAESFKLVRCFARTNAKLLRASGLSPSEVGRCIWFSRNGHGTGFWDRVPSYDPRADACAKLHELALKTLGHCDVFPEMFADSD
jgi:hypothetical protein